MREQAIKYTNNWALSADNWIRGECKDVQIHRGKRLYYIKPNDWRLLLLFDEVAGNAFNAVIAFVVVAAAAAPGGFFFFFLLVFVCVFLGLDWILWYDDDVYVRLTMKFSLNTTPFKQTRFSRVSSANDKG